MGRSRSIAGSGGIDALNASNDKLLWHTQLKVSPNVNLSRIVLLNDELYVATEGPVGVGPYVLHAFNAQTGTEDWYATLPSIFPVTNLVDIAE